MTIYERLGLRPSINGLATVTFLGGSVMPPEVVQAMAESANAYVDVMELQRAVGRRIAGLTRNEAAYVCAGASAGLFITAAACMAGLDEQKRESLPDARGMKNEIIVHAHGDLGYTYILKLAGATVVQPGTPDTMTPADLESAINEQTAAIYYMAYGPPDTLPRHGILPLAVCIEIGRRHSVPIVVDAAAQVPPASNLWAYTHLGADLAIFSGGKGLRGPQSSGLVVGSRALIEACIFNGYLGGRIARPMKVCKEEIVGLLAAVELYLSRNANGEDIAEYRRRVGCIAEHLSPIPWITLKETEQTDVGKPFPSLEVAIDRHSSPLSATQLCRTLADGSPPILLSRGGESDSLTINPQTLRDGEELVIARRIGDLLQ